MLSYKNAAVPAGPEKVWRKWGTGKCTHGAAAPESKTASRKVNGMLLCMDAPLGEGAELEKYGYWDKQS